MMSNDFSWIILWALSIIAFFVIKAHLEQLKEVFVNWRHLRRRDVIPIVLVIVFVVGAETLFPSTRFTGLKLSYDQAINMHAPEKLSSPDHLTYGDVGRLAPWLKGLSRYTPKFWQEQQARLSEEWMEAEERVLRLEKEIAIMREYARNRDHARWRKENEHKRALREARELNRRIFATASLAQKFTTDTKFPQFDHPIEVLSMQGAYSPTSSIIYFDDPIKGPQRKIHSEQDLWSQIFERNLRNDVRQYAKALFELRCYVAFSGKDSGSANARRFCDAALPALIHYDVTHPDCPPAHASEQSAYAITQTRSSEEVVGCIEQWTYPNVQMRIDEAGISFYPPRSDMHTGYLSDEEKLPVTRWALRVGDTLYPLSEATRLTWDQIPFRGRDFPNVSLLHTVQNVDVNSRWWSNFELDKGYLGNPQSLVRARAYRNHAFTRQDVPIGYGHIFLDAVNFVIRFRDGDGAKRDRIQSRLASQARKIIKLERVINRYETKCQIFRSFTELLNDDLKKGDAANFLKNPHDIPLLTLVQAEYPEFLMYLDSSGQFECDRGLAALLVIQSLYDDFKQSDLNAAQLQGRK